MSRGATLKSAAARLSACFYLPAAGPPPATAVERRSTESTIMTRPQIALPRPVESLPATPDNIVPVTAERTGRLPKPSGGLSRRSLIAGAAAAVPLTAATGASATCVLSGPTPADELAALGRRYVALDAAYLEAFAAVDAALDAVEKAAPPPNVLSVTEADISLLGIKPHCVGLDFTERDVEVLRAKPRRRNAVGYRDTQTGKLIDDDIARTMSKDEVIQVTYRPVWSEAQARAEQIIAAHDGWKSEWAAARDRFNVDKLEAARTVASNARRACARLIATARAATLDAMLIRMKILRELFSDDEIATGVFEGGSTDILMVNATIRDLVALLPQPES